MLANSWKRNRGITCGWGWPITGIAAPTYILVSLLLSACAIERAETAATAKRTMVGMTKEQVLTCMGPPAQTAQTGSTEVWRYGSGGDSLSGAVVTGTSYGSGATATGIGWSRNRYCIVDVVMRGGRVSKVNYSGRTGGLFSRGEQCAFAIENCVR